MFGFVPGIHVVLVAQPENADGRDKPGHDVESWPEPQSPLNLPQVRGLKRAGLRPGVIRPATLQPGRF